MSKDAGDLLHEAAETFKERNAVYRDNYKMVGGALDAFFPDGLNLNSEDDFNRFHIFMLDIVKLSRYAANWDKGGHQDSIHDSVVYGAMLESIDSDIAAKRAYQEAMNLDD